MHEDWKGKIQVDVGKSKVSLIDAYFTYSGFNGAEVTIGSRTFGFSREQLTSSKYQQQDADGYNAKWERTSVGANYFVKNHDIKVQLSCRMGENKDGEADNDLDELFVQAQYVF